MAARPEDRPRGEPELPRAALPDARRARRRRDDRAHEGQAPAADRPHRHLDHRGEQPAAARVQQPRARLRERAERPRAERARRRQQAQALLRRAGRAARAHDATVARVHVLQHGGPGRRRLHAGQGRAAPRDHHGVQRPRADRRLVPGPGDRGDAADSAGGVGTRRRHEGRGALRSRRSRRSCSTASATRIATATASASCPTASRSTLQMGSATSGRDRSRDELWKKCLATHRHPHRLHRAEVAGPAEDGTRRQAADVAGRLDHAVQRGRRVHAAAVLEEHRAVELLALRACPSTTSCTGRPRRSRRARSARRCTAR